MARSLNTTKRIRSANEVTRRLEAGNGKIKGLKLFASVDDRVLIPVEVVGINFFGHTSYTNGVHVTVKPEGGHGTLVVNPLNLIDNTPAAIDLYERKTKASDMVATFKRFDNDRKRRAAVIELRGTLTEKQKKEFDATAEDEFGKDTDMVKAINKASGEYQLCRIYGKLVEIFLAVGTDEYT